MTKSQCQRVHARRRAEERYGITFNKDARHKMVRMIQAGQCQVVEKQSHRVTVFDLEWEDQVLRVVYDRHRKNIVTFLPKGDE